MTAIVTQRRRHAGPVVLTMIGPADGHLRTCLFCGRPFVAGVSWFKVGFPTVAWIGVCCACSAAKDHAIREGKTHEAIAAR